MTFVRSAAFRWTAIGLWWCSLPFLLYGAKLAWDGNRNRVEDWLPASFPETQALYRFVGKFGSDELLMISWEGCTRDDPRLERYRALLLEPVPARPDAADPAPRTLFRAVHTGQTVLEELQAFPARLDEETALARLHGWLLGPDGRQTGLLAFVSSAGAADRHAAVDRAFECADKIEGLSRETVHIAGTTLEGVAADRAGKSGLGEMNAASYVICVVLLMLSLRGIGPALLIFVLAVVNEALGLALVHFTGQRMDSVLLLMANVTYVVSISAGVHFFSYYVDARERLGADEAPWEALYESFLPTLVALGTTAIGFASLATCRIVPIQRFGIYSAICTVWALTTVPFLCVTLASMPFWGRTASLAYSPWQRLRGAERLTGFVTGRAKWILIGTVLASLWGCWGLQYVRSSVQLHDLFRSDSRIVRDYAWLEERIGGLVPLEIVIGLPRGGQENLLNELHLVQGAAGDVADLPEIDSVLSAATFAPDLPPLVGGGLAGTARRNAVKRRLADALPHFVELRFLHETATSRTWRLSARVPAGISADYAGLAGRLRERIAARLNEAGFPQGTVEIGGGVAVVHKAQSMLIRDLYEGFFGAFVLIAVVLAAVFRSITAALAAMIPNIVPSILVFGAMGWWGQPIELGTMMTASAAMGIAVDDTLHCITWFREGLARGMSNVAATEFAFRKSGESMIYTTLVCTLGLVVFAASPFMPIARFSGVMFTLLTTALFCDLIVTPALLSLAGRRLFDVGTAEPHSPAEPPLEPQPALPPGPQPEPPPVPAGELPPAA